MPVFQSTDINRFNRRIQRHCVCDVMTARQCWNTVTPNQMYTNTKNLFSFKKI